MSLPLAVTPIPSPHIVHGAELSGYSLCYNYVFYLYILNKPDMIILTSKHWLISFADESISLQSQFIYHYDY